MLLGDWEGLQRLRWGVEGYHGQKLMEEWAARVIRKAFRYHCRN